jgi:peptidoglycan/LPS O-acetylase OafA/YrhL
MSEDKKARGVNVSTVKERWYGMLLVCVLLSIGSLWYSSLWLAFIEHPTRDQIRYGSLAGLLSLVLGMNAIMLSNLAKRWLRIMKFTSWAMVAFLTITPASGPTWVEEHVIASLAASLVLIIFWYEGMKEQKPDFFTKMAKSEPSKELK